MSIVDPANSGKKVGRKPIPKRVRFEVLRRDDYTCRYCRSKDNELTVDHVLPVVLGGTDDPTNLVACCKDCNAGKSSTTPDAATVADAEADAERWAAAVERVAERAAKREQAIFEYVGAFEAAWTDWGFGPSRTPVPRPSNWEDSVRHWRTAGLPIEVLTDSVRIAMNNNRINARDTWRYFCGIAWSRVRDLQAEIEAEL